ncbi:MAG TPA: class I SAM-dependent methyltransferase, partial [Kofleriaceae bacterium]|nr:class I SAM-dependent methyltransferase [Kofleriaceae bacterium]
GYATVARAYADELSDELAAKPLDRALLAAFAERARGPIVDIGCGPGHVTAHLAALGADVAGVDLSPEMIAAATARHPTLPFSVADMFALPYAAGSLAGVIAFYSIVHVPTDELVVPLRELHRVLAPDGLAMLAFHAGADTVHVDALFGQPTSLDFTFHPPDVVAVALGTVGFALEARLDRAPYPSVEYPSPRTYLLATRRP